jgi:EmrB/QacA subfamily drug resistance transporter
VTTSPAPAIPRRAIVSALVLVVGGLAVIFDSTIMSIALKTLSTDLGVPVSTIQWVTTAYLLALGVAIPVVGWAQARIGGKRLWMIALTVFMLASIACSLAWNAESLIAFRVVQGIGGGLMMPLMATLAIQQVPRGAGLGRLMAMVSLPAALGPILGPTIGGIILNWLDWRWIFWVNVPFCLVGLLLAWRLLPNDPPRGKPVLDWVGLVLVSPALVGILYGLSNVSQDGGFSRPDVWIPVVSGIVLMTAFVLTQVRRPQGALVDVRLLRRRSVASSSAVMFLSGASLYGAMLLLPLYFQIVRGTDALTAALLLIPQGVGALLSRTLAGRLTDAVGARIVAIAGFAIMGLATIPFALSDGTSNELWLMATLLVRGFGMGAVMIPVMSVAFLGLEHDEVPHASIITRLAQQLGGAFGTAILAVILEGATAGAHDIAGIANGFDVAFWWAVAFTVVAIGVCLALPAPTPVASSSGPASSGLASSGPASSGPASSGPSSSTEEPGRNEEANRPHAPQLGSDPQLRTADPPPSAPTRPGQTRHAEADAGTETGASVSRPPGR